jgi:Xaa-Pro dipeptidase
MFQAHIKISQDIKTLYRAHLSEKLSEFQKAFEHTGYNQVIISSGEIKMQFKDDVMYPFKANSYFKEWVALSKRPSCYLQLIEGELKPRLFLFSVEDVWHTAPECLPDGFDTGFDIVEYGSMDDLKVKLNVTHKRVAYIGENNPLELTQKECNPENLLTYIDYGRRYKSSYEHHCLREANRRAVPAHMAASDAFMAGASELQICAAYLAVCNVSENDLPYPVIAGINENAAVLHHYHLSNQSPTSPRSFLIDAGASYNGYGSDISRTYAYDEGSEFYEMIQWMDQKQQFLVAQGGVGKCPMELNQIFHYSIAAFLKEFEIIKSSEEEAVVTDITKKFCPHSLGHHLGINVHDKGAQLSDPFGTVIRPPVNYQKLPSTIPMVAQQVYTVEPGVYFIPTLLNQLRGTKVERNINWPRVEALIYYGGIRVEDNIMIHQDGVLENFTRNAFDESKE